MQEWGGLGRNANFFGKFKNGPHANSCTYALIPALPRNESAALKNGPKMGMQMGAFYLYTIKNAHANYCTIAF